MFSSIKMEEYIESELSGIFLSKAGRRKYISNSTIVYSNSFQ